MTVTRQAPIRGDEVQVRFGKAGQPLAVRWGGQIWVVETSAGSQHWFDERELRSNEILAGRGGEDLSVENWLVKVRLSATAKLRTSHLQRDPFSAGWHLVSISDD